MGNNEFSLQFDPAEISLLAATYCANPKNNDEKALAAGRQILEEAFRRKPLREPLLEVVNWKSHRAVHHLAENTDTEIADVLRLAIAAETERAAIAVASGLHGVDTRVASAILTAIYPDHYTVIDVRALESLGRNDKNQVYSIGLYLGYLQECRRLAKQHQVSLRNFDRALWQWSKSPVTP